MVRGFFSILITAVIVGAISFGIGVYVAPSEEADQFRALVNGALGKADDARRPGNGTLEVQPAKVPQATAPAETETPRKEAEPDISAQPRSGADSGCDPNDPKCAGGSPADAAVSKDIPNRDAAAPSSPPADNGANQPGPAPGAESAAPVPAPAPPSAESSAKTPVAAAPVAKKPHAKAPAKKAKPKKKLTEQPPKSEPAEQPPGNGPAE